MLDLVLLKGEWLRSTLKALVKLKILTINTDCQPFIYYSDPGAGPAHINCPSAEE